MSQLKPFSVLHTTSSVKKVIFQTDRTYLAKMRLLKNSVLDKKQAFSNAGALT